MCLFAMLRQVVQALAELDQGIFRNDGTPLNVLIHQDQVPDRLWVDLGFGTEQGNEFVVQFSGRKHKTFPGKL